MATEEYEYNETGSIASKTVSSYNGDITNETVRYSTEYGYGYTANGNVQYTTVYSSGSDAECAQFTKKLGVWKYFYYENGKAKWSLQSYLSWIGGDFE